MDRDHKLRFEEVALPHLDSVHRFARSLAGNAAEADDLVQETFVRAFRAFGSFELRSHGAKPWLLRILHNAFLTHRQRRQRDPVQGQGVDATLLASTDGPAHFDAAAVDWDGFDEEIKQAVAELPEEFRSVLMLLAIEGLSYREIADVCECPVGTVMSRLHRARRALTEKLKDYARARNLGGRRSG